MSWLSSNFFVSNPAWQKCGHICPLRDSLIGLIYVWYAWYARYASLWRFMIPLTFARYPTCKLGAFQRIELCVFAIYNKLGHSQKSNHPNNGYPKYLFIWQLFTFWARKCLGIRIMDLKMIQTRHSPSLPSFLVYSHKYLSTSSLIVTPPDL